MIELAKRELGDKLFLITDAVTPTDEGAYQHVFAGDRYTMPDGTLSGSCLTMLKAVENCVRYVGIPMEEALRMGSFYPASLIGKADQTGKIKAGFKANLVTFNSDYKAQKVFLNGTLQNN
jgi:N-acetylglucosamine-6-phosphate deacetylase